MNMQGLRREICMAETEIRNMYGSRKIETCVYKQRQ